MTMRLALTIGMATYDDADGVWSTLASLTRDIGKHRGRVELLVVDNNPTSEQGRITKNLCAEAGARYVPYTERTGTSGPRDHVFAQAGGGFVLCIDSHVILGPGVLDKLLGWIDWNGVDNDLHHGRLVRSRWVEQDEQPATVWDYWTPIWGSDGMLGKMASLAKDADPTKSVPIALAGLGLFLCRRDAWLGFDPRQRHFGGEEGTIHHKFRAAGRQVLLQPWLT